MNVYACTTKYDGYDIVINPTSNGDPDCDYDGDFDSGRIVALVAAETPGKARASFAAMMRDDDIDSGFEFLDVKSAVLYRRNVDLPRGVLDESHPLTREYWAAQAVQP